MYLFEIWFQVFLWSNCFNLCKTGIASDLIQKITGTIIINLSKSNYQARKLRPESRGRIISFIRWFRRRYQ